MFNTQTIRHMQTLHSIVICEEHNILTHCVPVMVKRHNIACWQDFEKIVNTGEASLATEVMEAGFLQSQSVDHCPKFLCMRNASFHLQLVQYTRQTTGIC